MDGALSLADPILHRRVVLESRRRRRVRIPHQHADRAVLHAGFELDGAARSHRPVRRVWHARTRADAVLPARTETGGAVERSAAARCVLGAEYRTVADGLADTVAARRIAAHGGTRPRLLVRAFGRIHGPRI